jgi:Zn-dependent protease
MSTFYAIDSARVSHREYWWGTRSPAVLLGWILKWLRVRIPSSSDDPPVDSTLPFVVTELPPEVASGFVPWSEALAGWGFADPVFQIMRDAATSTTIYWATFRHGSGEHFARIHQRIWHQVKQADRGTFLLFFTSFTDGTFAGSSSGKPDMASPPTIAMQRLPGAAPPVLWDAHRNFAATQGVGKMINLVRTREELLARAEQHHVLTRDFHLARGVFRARTSPEQAHAAKIETTMQEAEAAGAEHAGVLAELEGLQSHRPGWRNAIIILVVSIVAFIAAGASWRNWEITLWLVPVLLLHEAGHWVAMKIFGYRNLRMFFIPLFGAAVTGQNWNVPGWKKALVSLAGPVPGIALGVGLACAGLVSGRAWLNTAALWLLLINGFNLVPVLPFDGGHVLHALLFCRNRWLDIAFRLIAIMALVLLSLAGLGRFFLFIGIIMAISLPVSLKLGKVTAALRGANLPPPLPNQDRIPLTTAQAIISAVKAEVPGKLNNKAVAQHALSVFETLNARPPGGLATLSLLLVHGGSVALAILCGLLLMLDKHGGGLKQFAAAALRQPQHALSCAPPVRWSGPSAAGLPAEQRNTMVATAEEPSAAKRWFAAATNRLPASATLSVIGDSVFLTLPAADEAAREKWFEELQVLSTNLFVVLTNRPVSLSLMFITPEMMTATNLQRELVDYFGATGGFESIPPWSSLADEPAFAKTRRSREQWRAIGERTAEVWRDPQFKAMSRQMSAAARRGAQTEMARLAKEQTRLREDLSQRAYDRLRSDGFDGELLDLHARYSSLTAGERRAVLSRLAERLGGLSAPPTAAQQAAARDSATGFVQRQGLILELPWLSFKDATTGLPAFVHWICQRRCLDLKYELHSLTFADPTGGEEEE